jgi:hypothetical protein
MEEDQKMKDGNSDEICDEGEPELRIRSSHH